MKRLAAEEHRPLPMRALCRLFGKSWQAYYQHDESPEKELLTEEIVVKFVKEIRLFDPGIGGKKLQKMYLGRFGRNYQYMVGRERFERIMDRHGLLLRRRIKKPRTTDSTHGLTTYPNLVKDIIPTRPNQIWVTDITYIPIYVSLANNEYYFCYLSLITDCYTKEIIAWWVGETLGREHSVQCLKMALVRLCGEKDIDLTHHSDRGTQYVSEDYVSLLREANIKISMTESGDPKDNAVAERQNSTIKNELLKDYVFHSIEEVRRAVCRAVEFYNTQRPHLSLDYRTPSEAAKMTGRLKKRWTSYREKHLQGLEMMEGATNFAPQTLDLIERMKC